MTVTGAVKEILDAVSSRGFAEVEEEVVEKVIEEIYESKIPDDLEGYDQETEKRLAAMALIRPDWKSIDVSKALQKAYIIEHPEVLADPCAYEDTLIDYLNSYEQNTFKAYHSKVVHSKGLQPEINEHRRDAVKRHFKLDPAAKALGRKKEAPRMAMLANPTAKVVERFLVDNSPSCIHYETDMYNGRWRITCDSGKWKSVSWKKRGMVLGYTVSLYWAAYFAEDYTGIPCQWDLQVLADELKNDLVDDDDS